MCGSKSHTFSFLFCGGWYARGRENVWFEEPHSPSCFVGDGKRGRTCGSSNHTFSLLFDGTWYARGRENVRFFEPHILSPVLLGLVRERKRECVVRRATHSPSYFVGDGTREAGRMCGSKNHTFSLLFCGRWKERENVRFFELHILSPIWWDMVRERQGERAVLRTTHSLSPFLWDMVRDSQGMCRSETLTLSLLFTVGDRQRMCGS